MLAGAVIVLLGPVLALLTVAVRGRRESAMRFNRIVMLAVIVVLALGPSSAANQGTSRPATVEISYEEFMKLDASSRRARFERANAETRATIMRTHAERWLAAHRSRLTGSQVALVQEVIALVTPALYRNPDDPELKKQFAALDARLRCRMRHSDVMAAFKPSRDPIPASWLEDLQFWLSECFWNG